MALSAILGAVIERVVVRRLERGSEVTLLTLGVALLLGINSIMAIVWTTDPRSSRARSARGCRVRRAADDLQQLGSLILLAGRHGLDGPAVQPHERGAETAGRRTESRVRDAARPTRGRGSWPGGRSRGAVGAIAGVVAAPVLSLSPGMMTFPLLLALAAATLGGLTSRIGAVVGGVLIGIVKSLSGRYVPGPQGDLAIVVPFVVVVVVVPSSVPPASSVETRTVRA